MTDQAVFHLTQKRRRWTVVLVLCCVALIASVAVSLSHSVAGVSVADLFSGTLQDRHMAWDIFVGTRLPRVCFGIFAGIALAGAGVAFQALLRNPLADPYVLGVTGGASLGGVLGLTLLGHLSETFLSPGLVPHGVTICAFLGAFLTMLLMYALACRAGSGRLSVFALLLAGVVMTSFTTALIMFVNALSDFQQAHEILHWLMGNLGTGDLASVIGFGGYVAVGWVILFLQTPAYNALSRGEEEAGHVGINVERVKTLTFFAASLLVGAVVARCGMIGFVGLIVPHITRLLVGSDHRLLFPAASLLGAAFLVLADMLARSLFFPTELPVGVITALVGGPFFMVLLSRKKML